MIVEAMKLNLKYFWHWYSLLVLTHKFLCYLTWKLTPTSIQLLAAGHPTEVEDVDLLILSSQWAGVACIRQVSHDELNFISQIRTPTKDIPTGKCSRVCSIKTHWSFTSGKVLSAQGPSIKSKHCDAFYGTAW